MVKKMKILIEVFLLILIISSCQSNLLEMSRTLWTRILNGGLSKIGKLDPIKVPIVKIDQSHNNISYRVVLKDLTINGLNNSKLESIQIINGHLNSNLSDKEAGYVSYNDNKDLDSIRYRFHTLVKESTTTTTTTAKPDYEKFEFQPSVIRVNDNNRVTFTRVEASQNKKNDTVFASLPLLKSTPDLRVAVNNPERNPSAVRVIYSQKYINNNEGIKPNYESVAEIIRPCIGACRYIEPVTTESSTTTTEKDFETDIFDPNDYPKLRLRVYKEPGTKTNANHSQQISRTEIKSPLGELAFSEKEKNQNYSEFSFNGKNDSGIKGSFSNGQINVETYHANHNYSPEQTNSQTNVNVRRPITENLSKSAPSRYSTSTQNYNNNQQLNNQQEYSSHSNNQYRQSNVATSTSEYNNYSGSQVRYQGTNYNNQQKNPTNINEEAGNPFLRLEKQPGYVDIIYARPKETRKDNNTKNHAGFDGLEQIIETISEENQRYIIHNFTSGDESLKKRNDAVKAAMESKRIKELMRYANEYQEKQGFYEEGMEFIYHFGIENDTTNKNESYGTRQKRQHINETNNDDDNSMHIKARIFVPKLTVKSGYELMGKVGTHILRGNGLLAGNFSDLIGDFTVELQKLKNETFIVRAARAKLISYNRSIKLEGMDEHGPVKDILSHGLMAAEAVAAMIIDDLATKAVNDKNADALIYKMYNNNSSNTTTIERN